MGKEIAGLNILLPVFPLQSFNGRRIWDWGCWVWIAAVPITLALLFCTVFFPVTRMVKGVWLMTANDHRWVRGLFITDPLCIAFLIVMARYFWLLEGLTGATVGKWALGLRVMTRDGRRAGLRASLIRNALRVVDSLPTLNILGIALVTRSPGTRPLW